MMSEWYQNGMEMKLEWYQNGIWFLISVPNFLYQNDISKGTKESDTHNLKDFGFPFGFKK